MNYSIVWWMNDKGVILSNRRKLYLNKKVLKQKFTNKKTSEKMNDCITVVNQMR